MLSPTSPAKNGSRGSSPTRSSQAPAAPTEHPPFCPVATAALPHMQTHALQGVAPSGTPAMCNKRATPWEGEDSMVGSFNCGIRWQCVEFARRWLWDTHGLILPSVAFAAHIFHMGGVFDPETNSWVPMKATRNGTINPPVANSLIIYAQSKMSFVGHIGVIVEASESYIRVADQNRYFHNWGGRCYSHEFPVEKRPDGSYWIIDPEAHPIGWLTFPPRPAGQATLTQRAAHPRTNEEALASLVARPFPEVMKGSPGVGFFKGFYLFSRGLGDVLHRKVVGY